MGALTSKPFAFRARSWELSDRYGYDTTDTSFSPIKVSVRGREIIRVLPDVQAGFISEWISDKARFSYDSFDSAENSDFDSVQTTEFSSYFNFSNHWITFYTKRAISPLSNSFFDIYTAIKAKSAMSFLGLNPFHRFDSDHRALLPFVSAFPPPSTVVLAGVNIRYQLPTFSIILRKLSFSNDSATNFFSMGFFTNNLLGELNVGSSLSTFFLSTRFKSRFSRTLDKNSIFYTNYSLYKNFKLHFNNVYCVFNSPVQIVSSELNFSITNVISAFNFITPHFYKHESLHIKNDFFINFPSLLRSAKPRHNTFFNNKKISAIKIPESRFTSYMYHFFTYSNYFTHFAFSPYSAKSNNILLSVTRQTAERSSFHYHT